MNTRNMIWGIESRIPPRYPFDAGRYAYEAGLSMTDNPMPSYDVWGQFDWDDGYRQARQEDMERWADSVCYPQYEGV